MKDLRGVVDAKIWAEEFNAMLVRKGIQPFDPDLFIQGILGE